MIVSGELQPGERLPPEQELADRLGVSRGSLREAVKALAAINVLDVRRGDGTFVSSLEADVLLTGLMFAMELLQVRELEEVLEIRRVVVPAATAIACERINEEQLDALRSILAEADREDDPQRLGELHQAFKQIVFEAIGNITLSTMVDSLQLKGKLLRSRAWLDSDTEARRTALQEQHSLLDAFERGDSELASALMTVQLDVRRSWVEKANARQGVTSGEARAVDCDPAVDASDGSSGE